jgi:hypothetical protein
MTVARVAPDRVKGAFNAVPAGGDRQAIGAYFGASRMAPSSRITSPLSISLVTI